MSKLRLPGSSDDHPDAARKHLLDAAALLHESRPDGAAYLSGYVVECALKSLWLLGLPSLPPKAPWPSGSKGHELSYLGATVSGLAAFAGPQAGRYLGAASRNVGVSAIAAWNPAMRYESESRTQADAVAWWALADAVFMETIAQMQLDGVL
ncbi:MAG: hypothetical protein KJ067_18585 [Vicinamibacteria bacterium]|nr:hypothetical protein [Vicinamibacteria bacterium]